MHDCSQKILIKNILNCNQIELPFSYICQIHVLCSIQSIECAFHLCVQYSPSDTFHFPVPWFFPTHSLLHQWFTCVEFVQSSPYHTCILHVPCKVCPTQSPLHLSLTCALYASHVPTTPVTYLFLVCLITLYHTCHLPVLCMSHNSLSHLTFTCALYGP